MKNKNIAVIFAGGVGSRMNSCEKPKQFLDVHGEPIIIHTLKVFENNPSIDAIVISCVEGWIDYLNELLNKFNIRKVKKVVKGGVSGQQSIFFGLCAAEEIAGDDECIVLIHDGVRPLITSKTIDDNIASVLKYGSCITSVCVQETVLMASEDGRITSVPPRKDCKLARAPQSFWLKEILQMHRKSIESGIDSFIDSCSMMKYYGKELHLIEGPRDNIKITTPEDFYIMRAILDAREDSQIHGNY